MMTLQRVMYNEKPDLSPVRFDRRPFVISCLLALLVWRPFAAPAQAEDYPSRPIRLIVPVSPGGITDIVGRVAADYVTGWTGRPVVVENRTGAGGNIGVEAVAKSPPDGYVLSVATTSQIAIAPFVTRQLGYDPIADLVPVAPIGEAPQLLV